MSARRRILLSGMILMGLVRGASGGALAQQHATEAPGRLVLLNTTWASVTVEVRVGPGAACDEHPEFVTRSLTHGSAMSVTSDDTVCFRREADPGSGSGEWTAWTAIQLTPGASTRREL